MAGRPKKPNHQLAALIAETGFSNKGLARRVVDLAQTRGYRDLKYNHSSVERWLRGEQPRPPTPRLLAEVLSIALGRPVTLARLGMAHDRLSDEAALHMPPTPADAAVVVRGLSEGDLEQRRVLVRSGFDLVAYSSAALRWIVAPQTALMPSKGTRCIGMADVREIREATDAFRVLDNRLGGGHVRPSLSTFTPTSHRCCETAGASKAYDGSSSPPPPNSPSWPDGRHTTWRCRDWRSGPLGEWGALPTGLVLAARVVQGWRIRSIPR